MHNFWFYSTDIAPTLDPEHAGPQPAIIINLHADPVLNGTYSLPEIKPTRGTAIATLGGLTIQEFDGFWPDARITMSEEDQLTQANVDALQTLKDSKVEFYFTDTRDCWRCRFDPKGLQYNKNLYWLEHNVTYFSYSIILIPISKAI